jgi:uncharacterized protein (DUF1810 family)
MNDSYDLERFVQAQEGVYQRALGEIASGNKQTHWMWFIFPQLDGLGTSPMARRYAISGLDEARAYLAHPILGPRLRQCAAAATAVTGLSALHIFGSPDHLKLRSSATLFAAVSPPDSLFHRLLDKYFEGKPDSRTLDLLGHDS